MPKVTQLLHSRVEMQTRLCATHSIDIQKIPGMISPHRVLCLPGSLEGRGSRASARAGLFQFTHTPSALHIPDHPGK